MVLSASFSVGWGLVFASGFALAVYWILGCLVVESRGFLSRRQIDTFLVLTSIAVILVTAFIFPYPIFIFMPLLFAPPVVILFLERQST